MVKPKRARGSKQEKKRKSKVTKARRKMSESLFWSSESDPQILKRQRSVSEKLAGSSSNFSSRSLDMVGSTRARTPRWVEFWSDTAVDRRRRNSSSSSSSSPERFFEMPRFGEG
ncbi:SMI1/KNR4-like domain containing protein [Fagus crenata]